MNVYEIITNRVIEELQKGVIPWKRPWACYSRKSGRTWTRSALAVSHVNGQPYSLLNQMLLGQAGEYLTFNQCKKEGGTIKKGAKARMVCFWKMLPVEQEDENGKKVLDKNGKPKTKTIPYLRYYNVFHIDDTEGIKQKYPECLETVTITEKVERAGICEEAEKILHDYIDREGITFRESLSNEAYYAPYLDLIQIPLRSQFEKTAEYYSTAFHESVHSTGHEKRLNRLKVTGASAAFGGTDYSKEELVAELGAASILHMLGIETPSSFKNSAAYVQGWLKALRNDTKLIVSAASKAEKAVALIFGETNTAEAEEA